MAPRTVTARQRMWQSMRVMRTFTSHDLIATAEAGEDNAMKFVQALVRAGYVKVVKPRRNSKPPEHAIYRLVRDTGPNAPCLQRSSGSAQVDIVTDRNEVSA